MWSSAGQRHRRRARDRFILHRIPPVVDRSRDPVGDGAPNRNHNAFSPNLKHAGTKTATQAKEEMILRLKPESKWSLKAHGKQTLSVAVANEAIDKALKGTVNILVSSEEPKDRRDHHQEMQFSV